MKSMTGYGKGIAEDAERKICVEIKSVNHRFLDLNIKLPRNFNFAEDTLRRAVKCKMDRGHLDIYVSYERRGNTRLVLNEELAKEYCTLAAKSKMKYNISDDFGVAGLFRMSDVIVSEEEDDDEGKVLQLLEKAVCAATDALDTMRSKEGELLQSDILAKVAKIVTLVDKIEQRSPIAIAEHRAKMTERINEVIAGVTFDEARLINEIAFYTDKVAIDEEIARLRSHIVHFNHICNEGGAVGKKLDFIIQEMNRETNTIGSKCCDSDISAAVIDCKCEVEKIREQIQNIE
ncbi:MAG: YicC family protein [Clostridia bacterium]|nr:YicC family protein [Clostridia bacterium]